MAVIRPEMVGVAVQAAPETVRLPPKVVRLFPETVKVLSNVVAPCRVKAPGVVAEPMAFTEDAPLPKVLVAPRPVAKVALPEEVKVVKAPAPGVVAPIEVKFPAAGAVTPMAELSIVIPVIVPPVMAEDDEAKLLAVTNPVPNVTGRLVVVLMARVEEALAVSITGFTAEKVV